MVSKCGPICDEPQLQASGIFLSSEGSHVDRDRFYAPQLGQQAFPPFGMVQQVLSKVRQSHNLNLILIAPFWPQRPWFPDLLDLLVEPPIMLPARNDLLRQPHFHRFHQNLRVLSLTAWRLSSNPPSISDSLRQWLDSLHTAEGSPLV